jgi:CheY-like chemotaxis protein
MQCKATIEMLERSTRMVDPALRASVASFLGVNEYDVSTATDSYDALWQLKHGPVNLITSDFQRPDVIGDKDGLGPTIRD